jgi:hypothetical protein
MYHDKEVKNGEPSSNNGWLYSALGCAIGKETHFLALQRTFSMCFYFNEDGFYVVRLPMKFEPPFSRDEAIGMVSLFPEFAEALIGNDFYYLGSKPKKLPSLWNQLKAVYSLKGKHRNFVWENDPPVYAAYPIVFRLWWNDRYYVKKTLKKRVTIFEWLFFHVGAVQTILYGTAGLENILWLQLKDLDSKFLTKFIDQKQNFIEYFKNEHVFNK